MASGDIAWESEPFDVLHFNKDSVGDPDWTAELSNSDTSGPSGTAIISGDAFAGVFPPFASGKQYKIKITEV
jgi:hypothetical protein